MWINAKNAKCTCVLSAVIGMVGNVQSVSDGWLSFLLESWQISNYYINSELFIPEMWNLSRKHVRIQASDKRFIKLNKFRSRMNSRKLREFAITFAPSHVYFSVLDWLFPEQVGKKYKGNYCVPFSSARNALNIHFISFFQYCFNVFVMFLFVFCEVF